MSTEILHEEWRDVEGFEGYEVSNLGRMRSCHTNAGKLGSVWRILSPAVTQYGYCQVGLRQNCKAYNRFVHVLVLEAFVGPCPPGMECCHFPDKDKTNNRLDNLSWGTRSRNNADKVVHGTALLGERHHQAKLTEEDVYEMIRRRESGEIFRTIGDSFGVSTTHAHRICRRQCWKHLLVSQ